MRGGRAESPNTIIPLFYKRNAQEKIKCIISHSWVTLLRVGFGLDMPLNLLRVASNHDYSPFKGTDRLCKVVELNMQSVVDKFFRIHLRHIQLFKDL